MARRPSTASVAGVSLPPIIIERSGSLQPLSVLGSPSFLSFNNLRMPSRTVSLNALTDLGSSEDAAKMDSEADELFTMNSVAQVKEVQRRLRYGPLANERSVFLPPISRNDADAKQEELRLMVGYVPAHDSHSRKL
jgi:hypothetical protein